MIRAERLTVNQLWEMFVLPLNADEYGGSWPLYLLAVCIDESRRDKYPKAGAAADCSVLSRLMPPGKRLVGVVPHFTCCTTVSHAYLTLRIRPAAMFSGGSGYQTGRTGPV